MTDLTRQTTTHAAGVGPFPLLSRAEFALISNAALKVSSMIVPRWLPNGEIRGKEYVALNPLRAARTLGSFCINLRTGKWSDFATGDRGGDLVALAAYIFGLSQSVAAQRIAGMLGLTVSIGVTEVSLDDPIVEPSGDMGAPS
jgi:hypothetical protein